MTKREKVDLDAKKCATVGLGINDLPLWAYKQFKGAALEQFNDIHAARLIDLLRKEEMLNVFITAVNNGIIREKEVKEVEKDDNYLILSQRCLTGPDFFLS